MNKRMNALLLMALVAATMLLITEEYFLAAYSKNVFKTHSLSAHRKRIGFETAVFYLSDDEFQRVFRLSRRSFYYLLSILEKRLMREVKQASFSSGGVVLHSVRLAVTLRL